ncbi:hypothetical protein MTO96_029564 [Rhipicephalus appendiculatus]
MVVDPVIRAVHGEDSDHNILAYADDLTPLASSPELLRHLIDRIEAISSRLGLSLNPAKCSSLHISGRSPVGMRPTRFTVSGTTIASLRDREPQRFLGRPVGFRLLPTSGNILDARRILSFMLAPWQRLDALRTFVYPALNFPMRCGVFTKTDWRRFDDAVRPLVKGTASNRCQCAMLAPWQRLDAVKSFVYPALNFAMRCGVLTKTDSKRLDDAVRPLVKRTLYLPENTSNHYLYGSAAAGTPAIPVAAELSDICRVDSTFKLLTTADRELRDMALSDAYALASARLG